MCVSVWSDATGCARKRLIGRLVFAVIICTLPSQLPGSEAVDKVPQSILDRLALAASLASFMRF